MHLGTFQLTTEGIDEPVLRLEDARRARDVAECGFPDAWFWRVDANRRRRMRQLRQSGPRESVTDKDQVVAAFGRISLPKKLRRASS